MENTEKIRQSDPIEHSDPAVKEESGHRGTAGKRGKRGVPEEGDRIGRGHRLPQKDEPED
jgi:hypothetical protein